jgi:hypothetical protein
MGIQLTFSDEYHYREHPDGITLFVTLKYGGREIGTVAKVDTGAEVCIFSREEGVDLGLQIEQGLPLRLNSLGGSFEAYGHEITIQTGEMAFQSIVYFAKFMRSKELCRVNSISPNDYRLSRVIYSA